jgi:hypothetical protein
MAISSDYFLEVYFWSRALGIVRCYSLRNIWEKHGADVVFDKIFCCWLCGQTFRFRQVWHLQQTRLMNQVLNSSPRFGKHIVHVSFCSSCIEHPHVFRSLTVTHLIGFLCGRSRATSCKSGQVDGTRIAHHPVDPLLQSQLHCIGELKHFAITMFVEDGKIAFKLRQGNAHFPWRW